MSEQLTVPTPDEYAASQLLGHTKEETKKRIISHMNGVGSSIINRYPMIEEKSWNIQAPEANSVIALGEEALNRMDPVELRSVAPFLLDVCAAHYGPTEGTELVAQLITKAFAVHQNAVVWAALAAFVNGLRARMEDRVDASTSVNDLYIIESETQSELGAFRNHYGV